MRPITSVYASDHLLAHPVRVTALAHMHWCWEVIGTDVNRVWDHKMFRRDNPKAPVPLEYRIPTAKIDDFPETTWPPLPRPPRAPTSPYPRLLTRLIDGPPGNWMSPELYRHFFDHPTFRMSGLNTFDVCLVTAEPFAFAVQVLETAELSREQKATLKIEYERLTFHVATLDRIDVLGWLDWLPKDTVAMIQETTTFTASDMLLLDLLTMRGVSLGRAVPLFKAVRWSETVIDTISKVYDHRALYAGTM